MPSQPCRALCILVGACLSLLPLAGFAEGEAPAAPAPDCPVHVVKRGDTLRLIALRYLGNRDLSGQVHAANRARIGTNPDIIEPGQRLRIPCGASASASAPTPAPPDSAAPVAFEATADDPQAQPRSLPDEPHHVADLVAPTPRIAPGSAAGLVTPQDRITAAPAAETRAEGVEGSAQQAEVRAAEVEIAAVTPAPPAPPAQDVVPEADIYVLTGAPYLPFIDPAHPGGGMVTELILAAFAETEGPPIRIGFVNDRAAHLDIILPRGGFAFSFPWLIPECTSGDLTPPQAALCTRFVASDSLYEHVTEFFVRADSDYANARVPGDLAGAQICRAAGYPVDDLLRAGLLPDKAQLVRRYSPIDCLIALDRGRVDVASMDGGLARALVAQHAPEQPILVLDGLTRIERLHAVALKGDAAGIAAIDRLNAGLAILVETGLWVQIVNTHLGRKG